ncbi:MAG: exported protein of unknown function [Candidatus Saccharibacteria bacterium]|nr:exported protein of unknown function [Candidatus Saccharibacteria bacterium]
MVTKKRIIRSIRNTVISILALLILFVGTGLIYTWVMGRSTPTTPAVATTSTTVPVVKHVEPGANVQESASVQSITSPIVPGDNASIIVKTNPGSWCTITVVYDKTPSKDSGLGGKTSDDFGSVTWTWTVESTVPLGKWPVTVTCLRNKLSAVVVGDLVVSKDVQATN